MKMNLPDSLSLCVCAHEYVCVCVYAGVHVSRLLCVDEGFLLVCVCMFECMHECVCAVRSGNHNPSF